MNAPTDRHHGFRRFAFGFACTALILGGFAYCAWRIDQVESATPDWWTVEKLRRDLNAATDAIDDLQRELEEAKKATARLSRELAMSRR